MRYNQVIKTVPKKILWHYHDFLILISEFHRKLSYFATVGRIIREFRSLRGKNKTALRKRLRDGQGNNSFAIRKRNCFEILL